MPAKRCQSSRGNSHFTNCTRVPFPYVIKFHINGLLVRGAEQWTKLLRRAAEVDRGEDLYFYSIASLSIAYSLPTCHQREAMLEQTFFFLATILSVLEDKERP